MSLTFTQKIINILFHFYQNRELTASEIIGRQKELEAKTSGEFSQQNLCARIEQIRAETGNDLSRPLYIHREEISDKSGNPIEYTHSPSDRNNQDTLIIKEEPKTDHEALQQGIRLSKEADLEKLHESLGEYLKNYEHRQARLHYNSQRDTLRARIREHASGEEDAHFKARLLDALITEEKVIRAINCLL